MRRTIWRPVSRRPVVVGLDCKQPSTWAAHGDARQTRNRRGHLSAGGEEQAGQRLDAFGRMASAFRVAPTDRMPSAGGERLTRAPCVAQQLYRS